MNSIIFAADPTPSEIGTVLLSLAFILLVVERVAALTRFFWPSRDREIVIPAVPAKNGDYATKTDILRLEKQMADLTTDYKDLLKSSFDRYDGFNKTIADLRVGQEALRREIHDEFHKIVDTLVTHIKIAEKNATESHKHSHDG